jgi:hypothetical protein
MAADYNSGALPALPSSVWRYNADAAGNAILTAAAPASAAVSAAGLFDLWPYHAVYRENDKALNLIKAGAASVIFYDNRPYPAFKQSMNIDEGVGQTAPQMFCVDQDTGLAVTKLLEGGKKITLTRVSTKKYLNPNADHPSWFSSWGPVRLPAGTVAAAAAARSCNHSL